MTILDEHLERVYLFENVEKGLSQLKTRGPMIIKAMETGNLFQARKLLNGLPDASLDELMQVAHKGRGFHQSHLAAKRMVKGDETEMQKVFVLLRGSLEGLKANVKDKSAIEKIDEVLKQVDAFAKKYAGRFVVHGFTLSILMVLIGIFFQFVPILGHLIAFSARAGALLFFFGILLYVVRIVLNTYFSIKGIR